MKNAWKILIVIAAIYCLVLPCFAAGTMTITDAKAEPGDVVYLTVTLNEKTVGNAVGVNCTYDKTILTPVPASSSWANSSLMQDFNKKGGGVWASETTKDLKGTLCILAFKIDDKASFTDTAVSCTVIVKNEEETVGTFTAEAVVSNKCDHNFGGWKDAGMMSHSRKCSQCNIEQSESHSWDDGVLYPKPNDSDHNLLTFTCSVCGGMKSTEVPATGNSNEPTVPVATDPVESKPTLPTKPTEPNQSGVIDPSRPTEPTQPTTRPTVEIRPSDDLSHNGGSNEEDENKPEATTPYKDYNQPAESENNKVIEDHGDHVHVESNGQPMIIQVDPDKATAESTDENSNAVIVEEDHDHEQTSISVGSVCAVLGALVSAVVICLYFVKKKH